MANPDLSRLTVSGGFLRFNGAPLDRFLETCVAAGVTHVGLARDVVLPFGLKPTRRLLDDLGLSVTGYYARVGGWASGVDQEGAPMSLDDNVRRVEEAAELGADFVSGTGGHLTGSKDLAGARRRVAEGLAEIAPHVAAHGIKFGLEPLHPWYCPDRSVVSSLRLALDLVESAGSADTLGVVLDTYQVWWDGELAAQIRRAGSRVLTVHINDLVLPAPQEPRRSGLVGEGCIDFVSLRATLDSVGYAGSFEQEIAPEPAKLLSLETLVARVVDAYRNFMRYDW